MTNNRSFLKCDLCGNMVAMINDSGEKLVCCGQEMTLLTNNTVEASHEKHIPVATLEGNLLTVNVGSAPHPMTVEHHIAWIAIAQGRSTQLVTLDETSSPHASFYVGKGDITVYAYCNLHGLWSSTGSNLATDDELVCSAEFSDGCK